MLSEAPVLESDIPTSLADSPYIYNLLIPKDNLLRRIREEVDFSFAREMVNDRYCLNNGRPGIAPEILFRISFLQYLYNLSDREVIDACHNRLDFKLFLGFAVEAPAPCDYSTLSRARTRWGEDVFKSFFENTVEQARAKKLLGAKRVVDSSKTLMNAAVLRASELLNRLCSKLLKAVKTVQTREDEALPHLEAQAVELQGDRSWFLSDELKEKRYIRWGEHANELLGYVSFLLNRLETDKVGAVQPRDIERVRSLSEILTKHLSDVALEKELITRAEGKVDRRVKSKARNRATTEPAKPMPTRKDKLVSDVDPEARQAADHKRKVKAGYKTHVSMDSGSEIVTAVIVTPMNCDDGPVLPRLIAEESSRGLKVEEVSADSAYADGAVREALAEHSIAAYIPEPDPKPSSEGKYISSEFNFHPNTMTLICPGGRISNSATKKGESYLFYFNRAVCVGCPLKEFCLSQKELDAEVVHGRSVSVSRYRPLHEAARAGQEGAEHKDAMNRRLAVEHKQAEMLNERGMRNARFRGLSKTSIQGYLTAAATNIRRMAVLSLMSEKRNEMRAAAA